jgi:hypothetical protein
MQVEQFLQHPEDCSLGDVTRSTDPWLHRPVSAES